MRDINSTQDMCKKCAQSSFTLHKDGYCPWCGDRPPRGVELAAIIALAAIALATFAGIATVVSRGWFQ